MKKLSNHKRHDLCFLCLLWPFPVTVPLLNFARGSSLSRSLIYMDAQDAQDFFRKQLAFNAGNSYIPAGAVDGGRAAFSQWSSFHSIQRSFRLLDLAGRPDLEIAAEGLLEGLLGVVRENVLPGGQQPLDLRVRLGNELDDQ